ncbi:hypothetical protein TNCV_545711 [Trichonephila clavipes]|nr:hypothetical protein TNCV_545711 [Trichonephila clavipes]
MGLVILNHGQVMRTTPDHDNYHTMPTGGRLSSRQIQCASLPYTEGLQWYWALLIMERNPFGREDASWGAAKKVTSCRQKIVSSLGLGEGGEFSPSVGKNRVSMNGVKIHYYYRRNFPYVPLQQRERGIIPCFTKLTANRIIGLQNDLRVLKRMHGLYLDLHLENRHRLTSSPEMWVESTDDFINL